MRSHRPRCTSQPGRDRMVDEVPDPDDPDARRSGLGSSHCQGPRLGSGDGHPHLPRRLAACLSGRNNCQETLQAFRRSHERAWGTTSAAWKLEHQRRGAPHFHLYVAVPVGMTSWRTGRGQGATTVEGGHQDWLSATPTSAKSTPVPARRCWAYSAPSLATMRAHGRYSDPKRLASYFARHHAKGSASKEHQHEVPTDWPHHGRWWGRWHLDLTTASVKVPPADWIEYRRIVRRWLHSRRIVVRVKVQRIDRRTGQVRFRCVRRRFRIPSLSGSPSAGGFLLMEDAPALARALSNLPPKSPLPDVVPAP